MITTPDEMRLIVQEWFGQAVNCEELFEIYYAVRSEGDKQATFMANAIMGKDDENG